LNLLPVLALIRPGPTRIDRGFNAAPQDLAEDIAKYKANTGIDPADAAPAAPEPAKPRRARKPTK